jgi:hypothetical protein
MKNQSSLFMLSKSSQVKVSIRKICFQWHRSKWKNITSNTLMKRHWTYWTTTFLWFYEMMVGWIWEISYVFLRSTLRQPTMITSIAMGKGLVEGRHYYSIEFPLHLSRSPMQTKFYVSSLQVSSIYANLCAHAIILK